MRATEVNFDGIVGPTHNYSGLSLGNIASTANRSNFSNPREAVLQGLRKMKCLADLGLGQAVLPPQERPDIRTLKQLGYTGSDEVILARAAKDSPELISAVSSASCMWTANAATVSPSADTADGKLHFTPANLVSKFHRSIEPETTATVLRVVFNNPSHFVHHAWLPCVAQLGDEGAANHTRLCAEYGEKGVELFVYGRLGLKSAIAPKHFPARQSFDASSAIARLHRLDEGRVVFAQQNPDAVDAGVFHNDVAGVGNRNAYFYHEESFVNHDSVIDELRRKFETTCSDELILIPVPGSAVSLQDAVTSYLFNSQLVSLPQGGMALILPEECKSTPSVENYLKSLLTSRGDLIREAMYFDLKQSMRNGGGPACLRLRVVMTEAEIQAAHPGVFMSDALYEKLVSWAQKHYRDRLSIGDLADPKLLNESRQALDKLTSILGIGAIYPFQR